MANMNGVTPAAIRLILDTDLTDNELNAFILGAVEMVNQIVHNVNDTLRLEITRWLAAHLIASTREQQLASAGAGPATVKFQGVTGLGLDSTQYGQQAKLLDVTGALAAHDLPGQRKATLYAVES